MLFWKTVHLFGVALGAGGAFISDMMFFHTVRDRKMETHELKFLRLGSIAVWLGLLLLVVSGGGLFLQSPERLSSSPKFLAKMTIVGVITLNGIVFHLVHFPFMRRFADRSFHRLKTFSNRRAPLLLSGSLSIVSWSCAIILGAWRGLPFSYHTIMSGYVLALCLAMGTAYLLRNHILPYRAR